MNNRGARGASSHGRFPRREQAGRGPAAHGAWGQAAPGTGALHGQATRGREPEAALGLATLLQKRMLWVSSERMVNRKGLLNFTKARGILSDLRIFLTPVAAAASVPVTATSIRLLCTICEDWGRSRDGEQEAAACPPDGSRGLAFTHR